MVTAVLAPRGYSPAIDRALTLAAIVHARQKRKGTEVPYLVHPAHVAMIVARHGHREPLVIAAILHDVLEDVDAADADLTRALGETFPELRDPPRDPVALRHLLEEFIRQAFGPEVAGLVLGLTDQKQGEDGMRLPWAEAKRRSHARLADAATPADVVVVKCADALHNVRQVLNDLRAQGLAVMRRFRGTPEDTFDHYVTLSLIAAARLGATDPLVQELREAVTEFGDALAGHFTSARQRVENTRRRLAEGRLP